MLRQQAELAAAALTIVVALIPANQLVKQIALTAGVHGVAAAFIALAITATKAVANFIIAHGKPRLAAITIIINPHAKALAVVHGHPLIAHNTTMTRATAQIMVARGTTPIAVFTTAMKPTAPHNLVALMTAGLVLATVSLIHHVAGLQVMVMVIAMELMQQGIATLLAQKVIATITRALVVAISQTAPIAAMKAVALGLMA